MVWFWFCTHRQGFRILVYGHPVVYSCVRASYPTPRRLDGVRGVHTSGVRASYVRTRGIFGRPGTPRLATIGRESATTTLGERRARGETTAIGGSSSSSSSSSSSTRARARRRCDSNADVAFVRSFVRSSVATVLNRIIIDCDVDRRRARARRGGSGRGGRGSEGDGDGTREAG